MKFAQLAEKLVEVSSALISKLHTYPRNNDLIDRCLANSRKILPYQDQTSEEDESNSVWNRPRYVLHSNEVDHLFVLNLVIVELCFPSMSMSQEPLKPLKPRNPSDVHPSPSSAIP